MVFKKFKTNFFQWIARDWLALLSYAALTIAFTYPVVFRLRSTWLPLNGDLCMKLWDSWWFGKVLTENANPYFTDYIFYPQGADLRFSPISWTTSAFIWLVSQFSNIYFAYKLQLVIGIFLAGYGTYLLIHYLTKNRMAAWLGGAIYTFAPYHIFHANSHPDLAQVFPIVFSAYFLLVGLMERKWWAVLAAAVMFGLIPWTGLYLFVFAVMVLGPVGLLLTFENRRWASKEYWAMVGAFVLLAGAITAPRFLPIVSDQEDLRNSLNQKYEPHSNIDPVTYFLPPGSNPIFPKIIELAAIQNTRFHGTLGLTATLLVVFAFFNAKHRKWAWFWAAILFVFINFNLGIYLRFNGVRYYDIQLPLSYLQRYLAVTRMIDAHYYLSGMLLPWAVLAGYGADKIFSSLTNKPKVSLVLVILLTGTMVVEYWQGSFGYGRLTQVADPVYLEIKEDLDEFGVVELPFDYYRGKTQLCSQVVHEKPISAGYYYRGATQIFEYAENNYLLNTWKQEIECAPEDQDKVLPAVNDLIDDNFRYLLAQGREWPDLLASCFETEPYYQHAKFYLYSLEAIKQGLESK